MYSEGPCAGRESPYSQNTPGNMTQAVHRGSTPGNMSQAHGPLMGSRHYESVQQNPYLHFLPNNDHNQAYQSNDLLIGYSSNQSAGVSEGMPLDEQLSVSASRDKISPSSMLPPRFAALPTVVQRRILELTDPKSILCLSDFDNKVTNKLALMADRYGEGECLIMLSKLSGRLKTKLSAMKNGPGYLDVAAHRFNPQHANGNVKDVRRNILSSSVFEELSNAVESNHWLRWEILDESIVHQLKKLPLDIASERLKEISARSYKHVDNISGCIKSILSSRNQQHAKTLNSTLQKPNVTNMLQVLDTTFP
eukprot:gene17501-23813_t